MWWCCRLPFECIMVVDTACSVEACMDHLLDVQGVAHVHAKSAPIGRAVGVGVATPV
jgi:hypothetical protein